MRSTCGRIAAVSAVVLASLTARAAGGDVVVLAYDHTPGTRLEYAFLCVDTVTFEYPSSRVSDETTVRARVEYEVLPEEVKGGHAVRCRVLEVDVAASGPEASAARAAAAEAAKLPCEGRLRATGIAAKILTAGADLEVKAASIRLNAFIGVSALGWARLPGPDPVSPGHRWGPGLHATGDGARFVYTLRDVALVDGHRVATIDLANEVDRAGSRERAEGRYTFDLDTRRWLSTTASEEIVRERAHATMRVTRKVEASLVR